MPEAIPVDENSNKPINFIQQGTTIANKAGPPLHCDRCVGKSSTFAQWLNIELVGGDILIT